MRQGEPGYELDTGKLKIGDGMTPWNTLEYFGGGYATSPDGASVAIDNQGRLTLYGFSSAGLRSIPSKGENGIEWIALSTVATTGLIEDLKQEETIELYGGSAIDLIGG